MMNEYFIIIIKKLRSNIMADKKPAKKPADKKKK